MVHFTYFHAILDLGGDFQIAARLYICSSKKWFRKKWSAASKPLFPALPGKSGSAGKSGSGRPSLRGIPRENAFWRLPPISGRLAKLGKSGEFFRGSRDGGLRRRNSRVAHGGLPVPGQPRSRKNWSAAVEKAPGKTCFRSSGRLGAD